jgi:hypothetical protein
MSLLHQWTNGQYAHLHAIQGAVKKPFTSQAVIRDQQPPGGQQNTCTQLQPPAIPPAQALCQLLQLTALYSMLRLLRCSRTASVLGYHHAAVQLSDCSLSTNDAAVASVAAVPARCKHAACVCYTHQHQAVALHTRHRAGHRQRQQWRMPDTCMRLQRMSVTMFEDIVCRSQCTLQEARAAAGAIVIERDETCSRA